MSLLPAATLRWRFELDLLSVLCFGGILFLGTTFPLELPDDTLFGVRRTGGGEREVVRKGGGGREVARGWGGDKCSSTSRWYACT